MRLQSTIALLVVAAVMSSCGGANGGGGGFRDFATRAPTPTASQSPALASPRSHDEFSVSVTTDHGDYAEGETITFTVEICNQGPATTTEGGGGSDIPFSFSILDEQGHAVADDTHAYRTMELRMVRWTPGQCRGAQSTWDQRYWNRPQDRPSEPPEIHGTPQRGETVPAGAYRVRISTCLGSSTSAPFKIHR